MESRYWRYLRWYLGQDMVLCRVIRDSDSETHHHIACAVIDPASYNDGIAEAVTNSRGLDRQLHELLLRSQERQLRQDRELIRHFHYTGLCVLEPGCR